MAYYEYQGKHFEIATDDPAVARQKIQSFLGESQPETDGLTKFGRTAASTVDTAANMVGGALGSVAYPFARAGNSAEYASGVSDKIATALSNPVGRAFGITETPEYQNEASRRGVAALGQAIGPAIQSGSQAVANGVNSVLPNSPIVGQLAPADVQNMGETMLGALGAKLPTKQIVNAAVKPLATAEMAATDAILGGGGGAAVAAKNAAVDIAKQHLSNPLKEAVEGYRVGKYGDQGYGTSAYSPIDPALLNQLSPLEQAKIKAGGGMLQNEGQGMKALGEQFAKNQGKITPSDVGYGTAMAIPGFLAGGPVGAALGAAAGKYLVNPAVKTIVDKVVAGQKRAIPGQPNMLKQGPTVTINPVAPAPTGGLTAGDIPEFKNLKVQPDEAFAAAKRAEQRAAEQAAAKELENQQQLAQLAQTSPVATTLANLPMTKRAQLSPWNKPEPTTQAQAVNVPEAPALDFQDWIKEAAAKKAQVDAEIAANRTAMKAGKEGSGSGNYMIAANNYRRLAQQETNPSKAAMYNRMADDIEKNVMEHGEGYVAPASDIPTRTEPIASPVPQEEVMMTTAEQSRILKEQLKNIKKGPGKNTMGMQVPGLNLDAGPGKPTEAFTKRFEAADVEPNEIMKTLKHSAGQPYEYRKGDTLITEHPDGRVGVISPRGYYESGKGKNKLDDHEVLQLPGNVTIHKSTFKDRTTVNIEDKNTGTEYSFHDGELVYAVDGNGKEIDIQGTFDNKDWENLVNRVEAKAEPVKPVANEADELMNVLSYKEGDVKVIDTLRKSDDSRALAIADALIKSGYGKKSK